MKKNWNKDVRFAEIKRSAFDRTNQLAILDAMKKGANGIILTINQGEMCAVHDLSARFITKVAILPCLNNVRQHYRVAIKWN